MTENTIDPKKEASHPNHNKQTYKIEIMPGNEVIEATEGENLYQLLRRYDLPVGGGSITSIDYAKCLVRLEKGVLSTSENEEVEASMIERSKRVEGWVLACFRNIIGNATIYLPALEALKTKFKLNKQLNVVCRPLVSGEFGVAVDVGTTSIAAGLVDLSNGQILSLESGQNNQSTYGKDVVSRIEYCRDHKDGTKLLQQTVWQDIEDLIRRLTHHCGKRTEAIKGIVLVANTPMSHILLGVDPSELITAPYRPKFTNPQVKTSDKFPVQSLKAKVFLLPNISAMIGSDTVAAILATGIAEKKDDKKLTFLIDLGTNSELVLSGGGHLLTASTGSGSAFEGVNISCGTRAVLGAINKVLMEDDVIIETIDGGAPIGICGAGLISAVAAFIRIGLLDQDGRLFLPQDIPEAIQKRFQHTMDGIRFVLHFGKTAEDDIFISQKDIHQLQLAKGAIFATAQMLLKEIGAKNTDIQQVQLAGAFASHINFQDALTIGLLPSLPVSKIISAGNAAWQGACLALSNEAIWHEASLLAKEIEVRDYGSKIEFADIFINAMNFFVK